MSSIGELVLDKEAYRQNGKVIGEIKFCPKCHVEVYRVRYGKDNIGVIQGGRTLLNLGRSSNVSMSISCPSGHSVKLMIKPEETKVGSP